VRESATQRHAHQPRPCERHTDRSVLLIVKKTNDLARTGRGVGCMGVFGGNAVLVFIAEYGVFGCFMGVPG